MHNRKASSGFSLVEVMVAVGMMGILSLVVARLTSTQVKSAKTVEARFEYNTIINEIRSTLSDRASCMATFGNRNINTAPNIAVASRITRIVEVPSSGPNVIKYTSNLANTGPRYGNGRVRITSYALTSSDPTDTAIGIAATSTEGLINLLVTFYLGEGDVYSSSTTTRKIRLRVRTISTADRRIDDCIAAGDSSGQFVQITGDTMVGDLIMDSANITMTDGSEIIFNSDKRLKHDIEKLPKSLAQLSKLNPVSFKWNSSQKTHYGFIAQEVKVPFPRLVTEGENGIHSIDYTQFTPIIVKSVQELDQENKKLKKEIAILKREQEEMKKLILKVIKE